MADLDPSAAICTCGRRGCEFAAEHAAAFVTPVPSWRQSRAARKRHKRGR